MPMLNFQKQFVETVLGSLTRQEAQKGVLIELWGSLAHLPLPQDKMKRGTIRANRKDGRDPKAGDTLYLYTGARTSNCQKLGEVVCKSSKAIEITEEGVNFPNGDGWRDDQLKPELLDQFAQADGFTDWAEMIAWFKKNHGLPFAGHHIEW